MPNKMPEQIEPFRASDCCGVDYAMEVWQDGAKEPLLFCMHHFNKALAHIREKSYPFRKRGAKL